MSLTVGQCPWVRHLGQAYDPTLGTCQRHQAHVISKYLSIHYINEHYDEGSIIFQATCPVLPDDSPEEVAKKVHALEYEHFPHTVEEVISNR